MIVDSLIDISGGSTESVPAVHGLSKEGPTWVDSGLTDIERSNIEVVRRFWEVWKEIPFRPAVLREYFTPDPVVRTGWRGDHVCLQLDDAMDGFISEVQRQVEHDEVSDFRIPVIVARGPIVFHTWTWIATSARLGYRFERPMVAIFLFREGKIERWDSYATGKESAVGYLGDGGPDGL